MSAAVSSLMGVPTSGAPLDNLQSYLNDTQSGGPPPPPPPPPSAPAAWQQDGFVPTTRTIVEAVKTLNIQDVHWFLHQLDLDKNGGRRSNPTVAAANTATPPSATTSPTPTSSLTNNTATPNGAATTNTNGNIAAAVPSSSSASPPSASGSVTTPPEDGSLKPSPLLSQLPSDALQLPTSSPYILDILLDTIIGMQAQQEFAEIRIQKDSNLSQAKTDAMDVELLNLLTPLPPIKSPSLQLPSPQSEHAFQILEGLVEAVDIVGVNTLSKSSAIDYLKMSNIPYPISEHEDGSDDWQVTPEWRRRVRLLEEYGAVLDVDRPSEEQESNSLLKRLKKYSAAAAAASASEPGTFSPLSLPPPPRPTDFVHPPFVVDDRKSQETYLQHLYLHLLEKRQLFVTLVTEVLTRVRNARAQSNYQLGLQKSAAEARVTKIVNDITTFETSINRSIGSSTDANAQQAIDLAAAEKIERQATDVRREEMKVYREAVGIKGVRFIKDEFRRSRTDLEEARSRYLELRLEGRSKLEAIEKARQELSSINHSFDKYALKLEARLKKQEQEKEEESKLIRYVSACENAVKLAKKSLKETLQRVAQSHATQAARQVVEFDMSGIGCTLLFANSLGGVSNLFLKFFRCMSPAPDPNDPSPEVVWCPEPCAVTELCSPSPTPGVGRSQAQVTNPVWKTVRIDMWKLCEAERDRYFKVELWDCDASLKQVATVVRSAVEQAKLDAEAKVKSALEEASSEAPPLNPDGTPITPPSAAVPVPAVASVTLPSNGQIKYAFIGQAVCTLDKLFEAQRKRREEQEATAAVTTPTPGIMVLPIIHMQLWSQRQTNPYTDSGQLVFVNVKITDP